MLDHLAPLAGLVFGVILALVAKRKPTAVPESPAEAPPPSATVAPPKPVERPTPGAKPNPKFAGLIAVIGAAATAIAVPIVQQWEGTELVPYRDVVGIWTVCTGDTKNVEPGRAYTKAECEERLERQLIAHAKPVVACVPQLKDNPNALAASVSLAYNIGPTAFCRSSLATKFRQGDIKGGCDGFLAWRFAGGREIRGLVNRRNSERQICLRDTP